MIDNTDIKAGGDLPVHAQVVVIGAGVIGCSAAYHLAREGCEDVIVLERRQVASGTSWHSLGFIGLLRTTPTLTRLALRTRAVIPEIERESGRSAGTAWRGSVNVTSEPERMESFRRVADIGRGLGMEVNVITPADARDMMPIMNPEGLLGGIHIPFEGQCNPMDLTQTYISAARRRGARLFENTPVLDLVLRAGGGYIVKTDHGTVTCDKVVNCTGMWARDFGRNRGLNLPVQAVEQNYLVTEFCQSIPLNLPLMRDMDSTIAIREDARQLSVGFCEPVAKLFGRNGVPEDFCFDQLPPDWDTASDFLDQAIIRVPLLADLGIRLFMCGPEGVTPDTRYFLGPLPGQPDYFVACGFSGMGVGSSGGAGQAIAEWVLSGAPQEDLWDVDVQRCAQVQYEQDYLEDRAVEASGRLYSVNWPHYQYRSGRGKLKSPLFELHRDARASFAVVGGWEVADWFAPKGVKPEPDYTFFKPKWLTYARQEAQAALTDIAVADLSHMAKYTVTGPGALSALSSLLAGDPGIGLGESIIAPILSEAGMVQALVRVIRQGKSEFLILSDAELRVRDFELLRLHINQQIDTQLSDVSQNVAILELVGPKTTNCLANLSLEGLTVVEETRLKVSCHMLIGSLETIMTCYHSLMALDDSPSLLGRQALHSIMTFSGLPIWSQGVHAGVDAIESGLITLCDPTSGREFQGRNALVVQMKKNPNRQLIQVTVDDDDVVLLGHEALLYRGHRVGSVEQAAYALASPRAIGLAYIETSVLDKNNAQDFELLVAGRKSRITITCDAPCGLSPNAPTSPADETIRMA